jgi:tRNA threonylcarbamoyladenosine biosynthesis protein TsaE
VSTRYILADSAATEALGARLARGFTPGIVYLYGELGTGKTTLARGLLRGLGHQGKVRSPTYTLVEPYQLAAGTVYHLDLYRLGSPDELEWLGLRDMLGEQALLLVEWPERGAGVLPAPDLEIHMDYAGDARVATLHAASAAGAKMLAAVDSG